MRQDLDSPHKPISSIALLTFTLSSVLRSLSLSPFYFSLVLLLFLPSYFSLRLCFCLFLFFLVSLFFPLALSTFPFQFNLLYWHDVTVYILKKLTLEIYNINIIRIKMINLTTVTTITKGQNNHTLNNNHKHRGHVQVGWSVRHCPSFYGRQQCSALPTHSSLRPPPTGRVAYSHQRHP